MTKDKAIAMANPPANVNAAELTEKPDIFAPSTVRRDTAAPAASFSTIQGSVDIASASEPTLAKYVWHFAAIYTHAR